MTLIRRRLPEISNKQSAELLASLGDKVFADAVDPILLLNHASYIRESSAKTLAKFEKFLTGQSLFILWFQSSFFGLAIICRDCWKMLTSRTPSIYGDMSQCDVMMVSHLTNYKQLDDDDDPYFANLAQYYGQTWRGIGLLRLNQAYVSIRGISTRQGHVLESGRFGFFKGGWAWLRNLRVSLMLIGQSLWTSDPDEKRHLQFLACTQMDHQTMANARIFDRIASMVSKRQPQVVIITFEGYAWERAVTEYLHRTYSNIKVLGYQHAVISGGPRVINKKFSRGIDPDHILAAGEEMTKRLVQEGEFQSSDFTCIGSLKARSVDDSNKGNALVAIPEGILSETIMLAECLCEIARKMPEIPCVLRIHPILNWQEAKSHIRGWDDQLPNLHLSAETLDADIARAKWVLYRGSSVVINALLAGQRPLFLDCDNTADTTDIVPPEITWRKICQTTQDVMEVIESDCQTRRKDDEKSRRLAQEFAKGYYKPLDHKKFETVVRRYID